MVVIVPAHAVALALARSVIIAFGPVRILPVMAVPPAGIALAIMLTALIIFALCGRRRMTINTIVAVIVSALGIPLIVARIGKIGASRATSLYKHQTYNAGHGTDGLTSKRRH
jgi:hypothetical protein